LNEIFLEEIAISNHVKRRDIKNPSWFTIPIDIFTHPDFFNIDAEGFRVFCWIISIAAKCNSSEIRVSPEVCAYQLRTSIDIVVSNIEKLNGKRWVISARNGHVTDTSRTRSFERDIHTYIHTNKEVEDITKNNLNLDTEKNLVTNSWFEKFCIESFNDTGLAMKQPKVIKAFKTSEEFNLWVDSVMSSKSMANEKNTFKRKRYFVAALSKELIERGV
jgi:hypothetical protein